MVNWHTYEPCAGEDIQRPPLHNFLRILALAFAVCLLQPEVSPASAATQRSTRSVEIRTFSVPADVCPSSISFGENIQCSIVSPREVDVYTFTASAGDKVLVRSSKSSGNLWPGIRVLLGATELCQA